MVSINVMTECEDITTLPYNEGFENGFGCWSTVNGSSDGLPWTINNCATLSSVDPHGGNYVASSWSWNNNSAMHADAWLISPKFVLPNTTDSITFTWWEITNGSYPDSYSVVLSTTTKDTAAFTTVVYPYSQAAGSWTMKGIDLTQYAGQSVYIAFHHMDYNENFLLIDDISLFEGSFVPPTVDTLTVTFTVNNAIMGTTVPAPGTYHYFSGDTVYMNAVANAGFQFIGWQYAYGSNVYTVPFNPCSFLADSMMSYGSMTITALFAEGEGDDVDVTFAVNNSTMGTTSPAPGTYSYQVGASLQATAIPNEGYHLSAWLFDLYLGGVYITTDTFDIDDDDFANPMNFGTISQTIAQLNGSIMITAVFASDSVQPCDVPTGLHYTDIQNESIAIAWDANPNVNIWNIQYRMVGSSSFSSATSTTNSYNITNLTGLTNYEIQVQAVCENGTSDWCEPITVQTTNVGIEEHLLNSISLYPNPAKDVVNVQCALNDVQVRAIEVFDVYGKVVRTVETLHATSLQTAQINVSDFAAGMYFVRVTTEQGAVTKSFVKK
jgi:hypothetical protein